MISIIKYLYYVNYLFFQKHYNEGSAHLYAATPVVILLGLNFSELLALPMLFVNPQKYFELYAVFGGGFGLLVLFFLIKRKLYIPIIIEVESYEQEKKSKLKVYSILYIFVTITLYVFFLVYYPRPI